MDYQDEVVIASDGQGGAYIAWRSGLLYSVADIYIQRVDLNANSYFQKNGILVGTSGYFKDQYPYLESDGFGGAFLVWTSYGFCGNPLRLYAQRINSDGTKHWNATGAIVFSDSLCSGSRAALVKDGKGGAILCWEKHCNGDSPTHTGEIFSQHISADGQLLWIQDGVPICTINQSYEDEMHFNSRILETGKGGAVITWFDFRDVNFSIYGQKIDFNGNTLWKNKGIEILGTTGSQCHLYSIMAQDTNGGVVVCRDDNRYPSVRWNIYAQKVDSNGTTSWIYDGVTVSDGAGIHKKDPVIINVSEDYFIVAWEEDRNGTDADIFSQCLKADGTLCDSIAIPRGIIRNADLFHKSTLFIYPNPFSKSSLFIYLVTKQNEMPQGKWEMSVNDLLGRKVVQETVSFQKEQEVFITPLAPQILRKMPEGVYVVSLFHEGVFSGSSRFIIID